MVKGQANNLSATNLRIVLTGSIVLFVILSAVGFWFFRSQLEVFAKDVQKANAAASVSTNDITRLKQLEEQLENDKVSVTRAERIVADSKSYQYQDQIVKDLTAYAKASGVTITNFSFSGQGGDTSASGSTAATSDDGSTAAPAAAAPAGLKTVSTSITVTSPVKYEALLRFIHAIERNLTKMQLTGVSLTRTPASADEVLVNPLTVEVYIR